MVEKQYCDLSLLEFDAFGRFEGIACGVSLRNGLRGGQFNLGPVRGPGRGANAANWRRMADALRLEHIHAQLQVHGPDILRVYDPPADHPATPPADASFTDCPGVGLLAFSADCPLVAVCEPGRAVGVAHASWRCTTTLIVSRLVARMVGELGCDPRGMWAGISPSAGPCCYEVGSEVYEAAAGLPDREACFHPAGVPGKFMFDLWQAAQQQLIGAGLGPGCIETAGLCTICGPDRFFSYRCEGPTVGAFGLMIGLRA